ncbi:hypothetical protein A6A04_01280 [Paramagnetospirillum marisnigri]|uniref:Thioesterase n=1 Tax=Paramagnetospirillum marisnigri TaxID=1285242 RepID=A0A178MSV8_9PROT|nr:hypothetical protein A6A04_01280 [Paramagnetospirillum marisnigri]
MPTRLFSHEHRVHFGDSDAARIVYTPRFLEYAMEALEIFMADIIGFDWYHMNVAHGFGTPFVKVEMEMLAPLRPGDRVCVHVFVDKVGNSSLHFSTRGLRHDGELCFSTRFVCVVADQDAGKSIPIPAPMRARLDAYRSLCLEYAS